MTGTAALAERAKHILSIAKTLRDYPLGDRRIAQFLSATWLSGRGGLLAAALRGHKKLSEQRFQAFCANQGLGVGDRKEVVAWLRKSGLVQVDESKDGTKTYTNTILGYDSILKATVDFFEHLNPTDEERACVDLLEAVSSRPLLLDEARSILSRSHKEEAIRVALDLAPAFRFVQERSGRGLKQPVLFSPRIWGKNIDRVAKLLSSLDRTQREIVGHFVGTVKEYQGYPSELLRSEARKHNAVELVDLCVHVGLLLSTEIVTADGRQRSFLTTPHFFAEIAAEHGQDICDRVKIFLDSIRNGQHYGRAETGRIFDPTRLLRKLLDAGEIGPCTAIGTDYVVPEKEGIVKVKRSKYKQGQALMELVQRDTVGKVYDIVSKKFIAADTLMEARDFRDERTFLPDEQIRTRLADLPGPMQEAERAIILAIRE